MGPGPARPGAARPGAARRPRGMEPFLGCTGAALLLCFSYAGLRPVEAGKGRRAPERGAATGGEEGSAGDHGWEKRGARSGKGCAEGMEFWWYGRPGLCR